MATLRYATFKPETLKFLNDLSNNNNRVWFNKNKSSYEEQVVEVSLAFIKSMKAPLEDIAPHFSAIPKRSGGSLMRIYRDTRFSKDKAPYKTHIGIQFRHKMAKNVIAPVYYLHIDPKESFLAVGMWRPESSALLEVRQRIAGNPTDWTTATSNSKFKRHFVLEGESLLRPPKGFSNDHWLIDEIKRKDFIAVKHMMLDDVLSSRVQQRVETAFRACADYMRFLCKAVSVPF